jgi:acyl dehydratase
MQTPTASGGEMRVGDPLPGSLHRITRAQLVRYAGASGDFNPIHWNERFARSVGLPDVIAHGMLTFSLAMRAVTDWVGDPGRGISCQTRFTRPVVVPDEDDGVLLEVSGTVVACESGRAVVALQVTCAGADVLGAARAVVRVN